MNHFYYVFWVFAASPNCFYHCTVINKLPPEKFVPMINMTGIEEFFIKHHTSSEETDFHYRTWSAHRKEGKLPMKEKQ